MNLFPRLQLIVSAPADRLQSLYDNLCAKQYEPRKVRGCYNGVEEDSWAVEVNSLHQAARVLELADRFEQESMFLLEPGGHAFLLYTQNNHIQPLGKLQYSLSLPEHIQNWSHLNGAYYYTI